MYADTVQVLDRQSLQLYKKEATNAMAKPIYARSEPIEIKGRNNKLVALEDADDALFERLAATRRRSSY